MTTLFLAKPGDRFLMPEGFEGPLVVEIVSITGEGEVVYLDGTVKLSMSAANFCCIARPENPNEAWEREALGRVLERTEMGRMGETI